MPVFLLQLLFLFDVRLHKARPALNDKPKFSGYTEVRDHEQLQLLEERLPAELLFIPIKSKEISHPYRLDLHDVANVEVHNPFILVQESENCAQVDLVFSFAFFVFELLLYLEFKIFYVLLFAFVD